MGDAAETYHLCLLLPRKLSQGTISWTRSFLNGNLALKSQFRVGRAARRQAQNTGPAGTFSKLML